jgi:hypothetical protein
MKQITGSGALDLSLAESRASNTEVLQDSRQIVMARHALLVTQRSPHHAFPGRNFVKVPRSAIA